MMVVLSLFLSLLNQRRIISHQKYVPIFGVLKSYDASIADPRSAKLKSMVKKITGGDNYSHSVISFDPTMKKDMFSFEMYGIVEDSIDNENWMTTESLYFCVMFVPEKERDYMLEYCKEMVANRETTSYGYSNMVKAYISTPVKQDKRFICSAFVAYIMQNSNPKNLHRDWNRMRPEDITIFPRTFYVMNVKNKEEFEAKQNEFNAKVKAIYDNHIDEVEEYNNILPKMMLQDQMGKLKTFDKILDWFMSRG